MAKAGRKLKRTGRISRNQLLEQNKYLRKKVRKLESEVEHYKTGLAQWNPFQNLHGVKEISEFMRCGKDKVYKYFDQLHAVGAVGYEYTNYHMNKRMIGVPFLIMKYFAKRNRQSLNRRKHHKEELKRRAESTTT